MHLTKSEMNIQPGSTNDHWHALFTRHRHEKSVANALSNKGYDVYLPLYRSMRQWRNRAKQISLPLFPCYVFIREGMDRQLPVLTTPGVLHILASGGRPAIVPQTQMDVVRQIVDSSLGVEPHTSLHSGDRVRVIAGPLLGVEGTLIRKKGIVRLVFSVEMLGRSAAVEVDILHVERVALSPSRGVRIGVSSPNT